MPSVLNVGHPPRAQPSPSTHQNSIYSLVATLSPGSSNLVINRSTLVFKPTTFPLTIHREIPRKANGWWWKGLHFGASLRAQHPKGLLANHQWQGSHFSFSFLFFDIKLSSSFFFFDYNVWVFIDPTKSETALYNRNKEVICMSVFSYIWSNLTIGDKFGSCYLFWHQPEHFGCGSC